MGASEGSLRNIAMNNPHLFCFFFCFALENAFLLFFLESNTISMPNLLMRIHTSYLDSSICKRR